MLAPDKESSYFVPSEFLEQVANILQEKSDIFSSIKPLTRATVPVIKLEAVPELQSIKLDITVKGTRHKGLEAVNIVKGYLKQYPQLNSLMLLFKYMLKITELNDPYTGGLGSYGLLLLLVGFLQRRTDWSKNVTLGQWFIWIMHFYTKWNPFCICVAPKLPNEMVSGEEGEIFITLSQYSEVPIIKDPLVSDQLNNVARTATQIAKILDVFFVAVNSVWSDCFCACHKKKPTTKNFSDGKHKLLDRIFVAIQGCTKMQDILF